MHLKFRACWMPVRPIATPSHLSPFLPLVGPSANSTPLTLRALFPLHVKPGLTPPKANKMNIKMLYGRLADSLIFEPISRVLQRLYIDPF